MFGNDVTIDDQIFQKLGVSEGTDDILNNLKFKGPNLFVGTTLKHGQHFKIFCQALNRHFDPPGKV